MWLKPILLAGEPLSDETLRTDLKNCKKAGPCGVGERALYLNSFYIDRRFYAPLGVVKRAFKRVAMSRGGFSGRGVFAAIPYLVVEFTDGTHKQCNFKREEDVDRFLSLLAERLPKLPLQSESAAAKLAEKEEKRRKLLEARPETLSETAEKTLSMLEEAKRYLEKRPSLTTALSTAARKKRSFLNGNHSYRYVALTIMAFGIVALLWGIYLFLTRADFAIYFTLFGLAVIFLFSSANVRPTLLMNKKSVLAADEAAKREMEQYLADYRDDDDEDQTKDENAEQAAAEISVKTAAAFPVPARYAHPIVLSWMMDAVERGEAETADEALSLVKKQLTALNKDVTVEQEEFDEIVQIKAMFLNENYR